MKTAVHLSRARGFTALELIIVLIIGFSIIGLSAGKMKKMMDSSKSVRAIDSILALSTAMRSLDSHTDKKETAEIVKELETNGSLPNSIKKTGSDIFNEWNGTITITCDKDKPCQISYPKVSKVGCNNLANQLRAHFSKVSVGDKEVTDSLSLSSIAALCNNPENVLAFID